MLSSTVHSKSSTSETPDKLYYGNRLVTLTSYPLKKYPIHPREGTKPHESKTRYKV